MIASWMLQGSFRRMKQHNFLIGTLRSPNELHYFFTIFPNTFLDRGFRCSSGIVGVPNQCHGYNDSISQELERMGAGGEDLTVILLTW